MRLQVTTSAGITYGGRLYRQGEELEMPDDDRNRRWALVFIVKRMAKRFDPVVLGTPPPAPKSGPKPTSSPESTAVRPLTTQDVPGPVPPAAPAETDAKAHSWIQSPWETAALEPQSDLPMPEGEEQESDGLPATRRRRYARRDLRPEE